MFIFQSVGVVGPAKCVCFDLSGNRDGWAKYAVVVFKARKSVSVFGIYFVSCPCVNAEIVCMFFSRPV